MDALLFEKPVIWTCLYVRAFYLRHAMLCSSTVTAWLILWMLHSPREAGLPHSWLYLPSALRPLLCRLENIMLFGVVVFHWVFLHSDVLDLPRKYLLYRLSTSFTIDIYHLALALPIVPPHMWAILQSRASKRTNANWWITANSWPTCRQKS